MNNDFNNIMKSIQRLVFDGLELTQLQKIAYLEKIDFEPNKNFDNYLQTDASSDPYPSWKINFKHKYRKIFNSGKFFKDVIENLETTPGHNKYAPNINPNIFFAHYNDFYNIVRLEHNYKVQVYKNGFFVPVYKNCRNNYKDENDLDYHPYDDLIIDDKIQDESELKNEEPIDEVPRDIVGIKLADSLESSENDRFLRWEFIKIVEFQSRILLNKKVENVLDRDLFAKIFVRNCVIQFDIVTKDSNLKDSRIDLVYTLDGKNVALVEIDEKTHNYILDLIKSKSVHLSTGDDIIRIKLSNDLLTDDQIMDEFWKAFCKNLYNFENNEYKQKAITLHMVLFSYFDIDMAKFGVKLYMGSIKFKFVEISQLPFFEGAPIDPVKILIYAWDEIHTGKDFANWKEIINKPYAKELIIDYGCNPLFIARMFINDIILNEDGIIKILTKIPFAYWSGQQNYYVYLRKLKNGFLKTLENILSHKNNDYEQIQNLSLESLKLLSISKLGQEKYFKKLDELFRGINEIGYVFENYFHPVIPFLLKSEGSFVNYDLIKLVINDEYLKKIESGIDTIKKKDNNRIYEIIPNYEILSVKDLEKILAMDSSKFKIYLDLLKMV